MVATYFSPERTTVGLHLPVQTAVSAVWAARLIILVIGGLVVVWWVRRRRKAAEQKLMANEKRSVPNEV